jgi:hypothetical protein
MAALGKDETMPTDYPENPVYYRLFLGDNDEPVVITMQWFDEYDYDQSRFLNEERYAFEQEAEQALARIKMKAGMPLTMLERLKQVAKEDGNS